MPSPAATQAAGAELARFLPPDSVVLLSGDLGSGKTTFVQGLARALGVGLTVKSPTYNYYTIYRGDSQLIHCDAYRMRSGEDMNELLLEEFLETPWCLCVEWPEMVKDWVPPGAIWLKLESLAKGGRRLSSRCADDAGGPESDED